ncbi:hypothetical protein ASPCADRAFT_203428 [Aspergillus carbonarius ITEM 5010]|uniref:Uncharacterized protein n=1 Tax=Aspergillus carbonarius (strain ITEM 5010) TaxID=602072 RepID=A0A1R3RYU6_ASPC5|nr:hypothetical protein ASPCADRAFT_203428 [Aspergillus carbonarius ITEM 5010]
MSTSKRCVLKTNKTRAVCISSGSICPLPSQQLKALARKTLNSNFIMQIFRPYERVITGEAWCGGRCYSASPPVSSMQ